MYRWAISWRSGSIPPASIVPGSSVPPGSMEETRNKGRMQKTWKSHGKLRIFDCKKMGMMDKNDEKLRKMSKFGRKTWKNWGKWGKLGGKRGKTEGKWGKLGGERGKPGEFHGIRWKWWKSWGICWGFLVKTMENGGKSWDFLIISMERVDVWREGEDKERMKRRPKISQRGWGPVGKKKEEILKEKVGWKSVRDLRKGGRGER